MARLALNQPTPGVVPGVRQILAATDFSELSERAVRLAHDHARQLGAQLHVLHVDPTRGAHESAQRALSDLRTALGDETAPIVTATACGSPADQIVRYAEHHGIDLIVVGTHGHSGVTSVLLGSVAEKVVRTAPCPVVTVRAYPRAMDWPPPAEPPLVGECVVCAARSEDFVCPSCRARLRALASGPSWISPAGSVAGALDPQGIDDVLRTTIIGRLGCHAGGRTYVVPMAFVYDGHAIYVQSDEGMKVAMMRANPDVCFQVDRIRDLANWESAEVWGRFHELTGREATDALTRLRSRFGSISASETPQPSTSADAADLGSDHRPVCGGREAVMGRIDILEKTGRFERR